VPLEVSKTLKFPVASVAAEALTFRKPEMVVESKAKSLLVNDAFRLDTVPVKVVVVTAGTAKLTIVSLETVIPDAAAKVKEALS
jgi:hypothetical protein